MDNQKLFADAKRIFGKSLSQKNVDTVNAILAEADRRGMPNDELAYVLATAQGESALTWDKRENMNYSEARLREMTARFRNWRERIGGREAELARKPTALANAVYANTLGNGDEASGDGWRFRGAGIVQLTGRDNWKKFGMLDKEMTLADSVRILFDGMVNGMFTGRKLADYRVPGGFDFYSARRIVNGDSGTKYATWAHEWMVALDAAGRRPNAPVGTPAGEVPVAGWRRLFDMLSGVRG